MFNKLYDKTKKFLKENYKYLLVLLGFYILLNVELPYKINAPGGFIDLKDRIKVDNADENSEIGLSYVRQFKGNIPFILFSYIDSNWDLIKDEDTKIKDESNKDVEIRGKLKAEEAVSNAIYSAFNLTDKYIQVKEIKVYVNYNDNKDNNLQVGDQILSVDNYNIDSLKSLQEYIKTLNEDSILKIKVKRDNKELNVESKLTKINDQLKLGVAISTVNEYITNPNVYANLKDNELGPSGGLMMAIDIYNKITNSNITKGDKITGTGTIELDGTVGEIGGVRYKVMGAAKEKAKVFLCPKENYEEALSVAQEKNYDIIIKEVNTLQEAINYLKER